MNTLKEDIVQIKEKILKLENDLLSLKCLTEDLLQQSTEITHKEEKND